MRLKSSDFPNEASFIAFKRCQNHLLGHSKVLVSISGGADSDIMLDLIQKVLNDDTHKYSCEIRYVWFDTGLEYTATKEHLDKLEKKYGITIERKKVKCPVPLGCREYGQPFLSKFISEMIGRLQNKGFDFKNDGEKSYEELMEKFPKTKGPLVWWCNKYPVKEGKKLSQFNINLNRWLKEYMIEYPPTFKISAKCCEGAKKKPSHEYCEEHNINLKCLGLRKMEGGARSLKIKSCYSDNSETGETDVFRPIWWFNDQDKQQYKDFFELKYSDCYEVMGMKRTGCCGCPFNSKFEQDLEVVKEHDPMLYIAANNIFKDSYEYTRKFREFKKRMEAKKCQKMEQETK